MCSCAHSTALFCCRSAHLHASPPHTLTHTPAAFTSPLAPPGPPCIPPSPHRSAGRRPRLPSSPTDQQQRPRPKGTLHPSSRWLASCPEAPCRHHGHASPQPSWIPCWIRWWIRWYLCGTVRTCVCHRGRLLQCSGEGQGCGLKIGLNVGWGSGLRVGLGV